MELARIRDRLDSIAAEVTGAWPRRTKVHDLAAAATVPLDALRAELDARARIECPDATADLYYPPADLRDADGSQHADGGPGELGAAAGPEYEWKLRELMALRGMFHTSDLVKPLADRGVRRDRTGLFRLVTGKPKQVDIAVLLALCDILGCQLTDLAVPARPAGTPE